MIHTRPVRSGSLHSFDSSCMEEAEIAFKQHYSAFDTTSFLDELRATEYTRLDTQGQIYLDYTGGGLYASSQLRDHMQLLNSHVFGNPHSSNPTSLDPIRIYECLRMCVAFVLRHMNLLCSSLLSAVCTPHRIFRITGKPVLFHLLIVYPREET